MSSSSADATAVLGFAMGLLLLLVALAYGVALAGLAGLALLLLTGWSALSASGASSSGLLAGALDGATIHHAPDEVVIEGLHRGERVRLVQTSAVPGTICRVDFEAPPELRGTIKAGKRGGSPVFVDGPSSTLPPRFASLWAAQALRTLLARCPFVRIRSSEVEVLVEDPGAVPGVIEAINMLLRALRGGEPHAAVQLDLRARAQLSADCPYCREALGGSEPIACAQCGTQHHVECFLEHGRCTVLACGGRATASRERDR